MSETPKRHQFYGRRKGHALRRHHLSLINDLLPSLRVDLAAPLANCGPEVWLEIGFGGGEHLAHRAELSPEVSFIGAEPFVNGVAKLLVIVEEKNLANIRIHDGDARYLLEALPDASLARIYLLYPDPWPKTRHHQRRFVGDETISQFHRLLKPGGLFLFASDIADYVAWTRHHVARHAGFYEEMSDPQGFEHWIQTRYEAKAKREGRSSSYLMFRKQRLLEQ
ncbi:tRNA (guanosine(46)-N7)-methyltransferase TrmB [Aestuariivirga sp.]|uniref:tRNA (guanosine(46)-N7)-methyltransferase TrmB n=1 Tax=Aestuariivirga sp. TaxID=2650926 RepID=UPI0039E645F4